MKKAILSLAFLTPIFCSAQIPAPDWSILNQPIENKVKFVSLVSGIEPQGILLQDSSFSNNSKGEGLYKYHMVKGVDTCLLEVRSYKMGKDDDLRRPGTDAVKELKITGHYLAIAPIYLKLFPTNESIETLKTKPRRGYFKNGDSDPTEMWLLEKNYSGTWTLRIYNRW